VNRDAGEALRQQQREEEQAQRLQASEDECRAAQQQLARVQVGGEARSGLRMKKISSKMGWGGSDLQEQATCMALSM